MDRSLTVRLPARTYDIVAQRASAIGVEPEVEAARLLEFMSVLVSDPSTQPRIYRQADLDHHSAELRRSYQAKIDKLTHRGE